MKLGIIFENNTEMESLVKPELIIQTLHQSFDSFNLTTKMCLERNGITKEVYEEKYAPLVRKCSKWYWTTGLPQNSTMSVEDVLRFRNLMDITHLVIGHERKEREKQMTLYRTKTK